VRQYDLIEPLICVSSHVTKIRPRSPLGCEPVSTHSVKKIHNAVAMTPVLPSPTRTMNSSPHASAPPPPPPPPSNPAYKPPPPAPPRMPPPSTPLRSTPSMTTPPPPPAPTPYRTPEVDNDGGPRTHDIHTKSSLRPQPAICFFESFSAGFAQNMRNYLWKYIQTSLSYSECHISLILQDRWSIGSCLIHRSFPVKQFAWQDEKLERLEEMALSNTLH
jgi:hypothetical protein